MPKKSAELKIPAVRITRSLRKRLESIDSDSERSNTPVIFESNETETSPNPSSEENIKRSIETPTKITRRAQSEAKFSDATIGSPVTRRLRRAGSVSLDDNQCDETKSLRASTPTQKIITRRSSLLLNESIDLVSVSSPSRRSRRRSINLTEDVDNKITGSIIDRRKTNLLDTCVPEEDTNDILAVQKLESKSPKNLNQNSNDSNYLCPAYCTRLRSKSPNDENQKVDEKAKLIEKNKNEENVKEITTDSNMDILQKEKKESNSVVLELDVDMKNLSQSNQSADKVEINISKNISRGRVDKDNEDDDEVIEVIDLTGEIKTNKKGLKEHKTVTSTNLLELNGSSKMSDESLKENLRTKSDKTEVPLEKDDQNDKELNSSSKMSDKSLQKNLNTLLDQIETSLGKDDQNDEALNSSSKMSGESLKEGSTTLSDKIETPLKKRSQNDEEKLNSSSKMSDKSLEENLTTKSDKTEAPLEKDDQNDEELNSSSEISGENLENVELIKLNQTKLDESVKNSSSKEHQDNEKTNKSKMLDINHHIQDEDGSLQSAQTLENSNTKTINDKKDKESIGVNNSLSELAAANPKCDDTECSVTPFHKRMSNELMASSTPFTAAKSTENDSSKSEVSSVEDSNETDLKKKHQSVVISHSKLNKKSSKLFPKTPIPSKDKRSIICSKMDLSFEEGESIKNGTENNSGTETVAKTRNLSVCSSKSEPTSDKLSNKHAAKINFNKSWSQAIKGDANTAIDTFGLKQNDTNNINNETDTKTSKNKSSSKKYDDDDDDDDDENLEKLLIDEEEEEEELNEFFDNEAKEVSSSYDSLDSEEREYIEQNQIPERGESIGSEDTDEEPHADEAEESDDEMDSFIVTDDENQNDDDDDDDDDEPESNISEAEEETEKTTLNKRKIKRILSSSEEDTNNETVKEKSDDKKQDENVIDIKNNKEANNEVDYGQDIEDKEAPKFDLENNSKEIDELKSNTDSNSGETVEADFSNLVTSKKNIEVDEKRSDSQKKDPNLLSKSTSMMDEFIEENKQNDLLREKTRHSLPAKKKSSMNFSNDQEVKNSEKVITETSNGEEETKELCHEKEEESMNSFSLDENKHLNESSSSLNLKEIFEEHSNDENSLSDKTTTSIHANEENEKVEELGISNSKKEQSARDNIVGHKEDSSENAENTEKDPYELVMKRCDEILEAACEAKRQAKLLNKNKSKKMNEKKLKSSENKKENQSQSTTQKQEKQSEKVLKLNLDLSLKQIKAPELVRAPKNPSKKHAFKTESSTGKRLPEEIVNAISPQSDKENKTSKKLSRNQDKSNKDGKELKVIKRKLSESDSEQAHGSKKKKVCGIIKNPSGFFFEELLIPKEINQPKIMKFPWGTVREEPITPETKNLVNGFKETLLNPKSLFKSQDNKFSEKRKKHKIDAADTVQYSWGTVQEEPLYDNPSKPAAIPKSLGHKVKKALTIGQIEPPVLEKSKKKNKKIKIQDSRTVLPKPVWIENNELQLTSKKSQNAEGILIKETSTTDFYVKPLTEKKRKRQIDTVSEAALEFKKRALLNEKVPRETSKQLLQKKEKKKFHKF